MHKGIAIALAWPQTFCKQAGAWYDEPMRWLGLNKNNYYKVGHAAVILVDPADGSCHYYDFGRYHTPAQHGRVRSAFTDHELEIKTKAIFDERGMPGNIYEILLEVFANSSCHGTGSMHASYCRVSFGAAYAKAIEMQRISPIPYGPFLPDGTNCSRFVNSVVRAGKPELISRLLLVAPKTLSPTPLSNVRALNNYVEISSGSLITLNDPEPCY